MEPSDKQIEEDIERLEQQEAAASLRNDLDLIEKLWSDKLVVSGASNLLFTKSQLLAFFRAGLIRMKSLERRITRVVVDRGKTVYCSYMNCWNREDGEWKLLGRQVTVVGKMTSDGTFERPGN